MRIEDVTALVTGANRGLGRAFAGELAARGARTVYAGARNPASVTDSGVTPVKLDITSPGDVASAAHQCPDVGLLINNAAILSGASVLGASTLDPARHEMETNYFGTLSMCRAFAPVLGRNGGGVLCNVLSIVSFLSVPWMGSFCASKAALWSMTNSIRMELHAQGTQVVAVHASFIDTDMAAGYEGPKMAPAEVARVTLDAIESGREEVLVDERTRAAKAALSLSPGNTASLSEGNMMPNRPPYYLGRPAHLWVAAMSRRKLTPETRDMPGGEAGDSATGDPAANGQIGQQEPDAPLPDPLGQAGAACNDVGKIPLDPAVR